MATGDLPSIYDWADGQGANYGTPLPVAADMSSGALVGRNYSRGQGANFPLEEYSNSPVIEVAEQTTITHRYNTSYTFGQFLQGAYPRGTIMVDNDGNQSMVLSTNLQRTKGGYMADLTIVSEGQFPLFANQPDEFNIEIVELNPALEKHPRYQDLTYKDRYNVRAAGLQLNRPDVSSIYQNTLNTISDPDAQDEALELMLKMRNGEDSFYLSGYKISWSQYYWTPQTMNPGGYLEDPVYQGGLPPYFWSIDGTPDGGNIFQFTTTFNGNMFWPNEGTTPPWGLSWLRQTDTQVWQRTQWKVTRTWVGAPIAQWDNELYNKVSQDFQTDENTGVILH